MRSGSGRVVCQGAVRVARARLWSRVGVHQGRGQLRHGVQQGVLGLDRDVMGLTYARPRRPPRASGARLAGPVTTRKEGRRVVYALRDGHLRRVVGEALNLADHRLADQPAHD